MLTFNGMALAYHLVPVYYQATLPSAHQGESTDPLGEVTDSITVGQTFVAQYPNLNRIDVALSTGETPSSSLILHLRNDPREDQDLAVSTVTPRPASGDTYQSFYFPPIADSAGRFISSLNSLHRPTETLPHGAPAAIATAAALRSRIIAKVREI